MMPEITQTVIRRRPKGRRPGVLLRALALVGVSATGAGFAASESKSDGGVVRGSLKIEGRVVAKLPTRTPDLSLVFSEDGRHVAFVQRRTCLGESQGRCPESPEFVVTDGRPGPEYASIRALVLSPDGSRVAFVAEVPCDESSGSCHKETVVVDQRPGRRFDQIHGAPAFSSDGSHVAYLARDGEREILVRDEQPVFSYALGGLEACPADDCVVISPDARHVVQLMSGSTFSVWLRDGKPGPHLSPMSFDGCVPAAHARAGSSGCARLEELRPTFSGNSQRLAYGADAPGDRKRMFIDGRPGPVFDEVSNFVFSPDGAHFAYWARRGGRGEIVRDGRTITKPGPARPAPLRFSPDSQHLVLVVEADDEHQALVVDGKPGPRFDQIDEAAYSPDGRRLACSGAKDGDKFVVVDGKGGPPHLDVWGIVFDQRSAHLAYFAQDDPLRTETFVVVDGSAGSRHKGRHLNKPVFLPDGGVEYFVLQDDALLSFHVFSADAQE